MNSSQLPPGEDGETWPAEDDVSAPCDWCGCSVLDVPQAYYVQVITLEERLARLHHGLAFLCIDCAIDGGAW